MVEKGKSYTKIIPQPQQGQLGFVNGYIAVQNIGAHQVQIVKGDTILYKLDDGGAYLNPGAHSGYYEIPFSIFDATLPVDQLKAFGSSWIQFPSFNVERGKLYRFTITGSTITGPVVVNIDPLLGSN